MGPLTEVTAAASVVTQYVELVDSSTLLPKTGVASGALTASFVKNRGARTAITMAALASATATPDPPYATGGWFEVDATNMPGLYRFDIPYPVWEVDSLAFYGQFGHEHRVVTLKATGCRTEHLPFLVTAWNRQEPFADAILDVPMGDHINDDTLGVAFWNALRGYHHTAGPGGGSAGVAAETVGLKLSAAGLDGIVLEALTGAIAAINARQGLQMLVATAAGGREGAGTGTTTATSPGGTPRVEYDTPGDGNRTVNSTSLTA